MSLYQKPQSIIRRCTRQTILGFVRKDLVTITTEPSLGPSPSQAVTNIVYLKLSELHYINIIGADLEIVLAIHYSRAIKSEFS